MPHIIVNRPPQGGQLEVEACLTEEGFRVSHAEDGAQLRRMMSEDPGDLVFVDRRLPDEDGFSLTRFLREHHRCGIIMTLGRPDPMDRIIGLEIGADDVVVAPCEPREMLARIRSVLRRTLAANDIAAAPAPAPAPAGARREAIGFDGWKLDLGTRALTGGDGRAVELSAGEFTLLRELAAHPGEVMGREPLLRAVHGREWDYFDRSIDVLVTRLRQKIERKPSEPVLIKTIRGAGYVFTPAVERIAL